MTLNAVSTKKYGNFDHFWSNLTPFDPRRDFRFGPRGEIFFLKHCQKSIDSDFLSRKHLKTTLNVCNFEKRGKNVNFH